MKRFITIVSYIVVFFIGLVLVPFVAALDCR